MNAEQKHSTANIQRSKHNEHNRVNDKPKYDLEERLLVFGSRIVRLTEQLPRTRAGNHIASQLLRCGTSPLSNHGEATAAESPDDFIHKLSVCLKELKETRRWIHLIQIVPLIKQPHRLDPLLEETEALIKIFAASIRTARRNRDRKRVDDTETIEC